MKSFLVGMTCLTILVVLWDVVGYSMYTVIHPAIEGELAALQVENNISAYYMWRYWDIFIQPAMVTTILGLLWIIYGCFRMFLKPQQNNRADMNYENHAGMWVLFILGGSLLTMFAGCGPAKVDVFEEIRENETAFVVPLEGNNLATQQKFMSVDYLNSPEVKIATKRIAIPLRYKSIGRMWWDYEWIPTLRVIRVDRTNASRSWTQGPGTGSTPRNEAICVESRESVDFCIGVTVLASIPEDMAALFLYTYSGKPLTDVMDSDVRAYAATVLAREFGGRSLDEGRNSKQEIFKMAFTETAEFFKTQGVTIKALGPTEGLQYTNKNLQATIDNTFIAFQKIEEAKNARMAQQEISQRDLAVAQNQNAILLAKAEAERRAAEEFAKAQEAALKKMETEVRYMDAQARLEMAKHWNVTTVLPSTSPILGTFGISPQSGK